MTLAAALRYLGENVAAIRIDFIVLSHRLCLSRPTGAIWSAPEGDAVCAGARGSKSARMADFELGLPDPNRDPVRHDG